MTNDLHYKTISELAPLIRDGVLSSVELTESQLDRIDRIDGQLKAYATVMADSARAQARAADAEIAAGNYRGPASWDPWQSKTWAPQTAFARWAAALYSPITSPTLIQRWSPGSTRPVQFFSAS